jgi:hypothetical protein
MEIRLHFVLFEELQEKPESSGAVARIVVIRESKNTELALDEGTAGLRPLE